MKCAHLSVSVHSAASPDGHLKRIFTDWHGYCFCQVQPVVLTALCHLFDLEDFFQEF